MASIAHIGYGYWGRNLARHHSELGLLAAVGGQWAAATTAGRSGRVPMRLLAAVTATRP